MPPAHRGGRYPDRQAGKRTRPFERARACARSTKSSRFSAARNRLGGEREARGLRAQVEQALLGVEAEVDGGRHLVGRHPADLVRVRRVVGRLLDQLRVGGVRRLGGLGVGGLLLVDEELDGPGRVGELVLAGLDAERARAARDEVQAPVGHPLEHLGDHARAADRRAARRRRPRRSRTRLPPPAPARPSSCSAPRRCAAEPARSGARRGRAGTAGSRGPDPQFESTSAARPYRTGEQHRPRVVPARPARPRQPGPDRGAPRVRSRRARLRARPAAARGPLPVRQPRVVPARLPRRAARGAARARRRPRDPRTAGPSRSSPRSRANAARPRSTTPPTSRRSRPRAIAAWVRRSASRCGRSRACSSPTSRPSSPTPSSPPSTERGSSSSAARSMARPRALRFPSALALGRLPASPRPEAADPFPPGERAAPRARDALARRRPRALRGAPRPARRRHVAALAVPALRLSLGARARGARARARRPTRSSASSRGATSTRTSSSTTRATPGTRTRASRSGTTTPSCSTPGARAAPAIRSSTPRCASCCGRAGCTTARG